ncbi:MAG: tetratricopeptide repeat protein [Myxococcota bacterium]
MSDALARCRQALQRGDLSTAWDALAKERANVVQQPEYALAWLELLVAAPTAATTEEDVEEILQAFPDLPDIATGACAALLSLVELIPPDQPLTDGSPADRAVEIAEKALLQPKLEPSTRGYLLINRANGLRRLGPGRYEEAVQSYAEALTLYPEQGSWWLDFGILHKWRGRFQEAVDCCQKARAQLGPTRPVLFNLAVSAIGAGDGQLAYDAFRELEIPVELAGQERLPFVAEMPPAQIRVPARGPGVGHGQIADRHTAFEILWVAPLSPCHGVVQSASFRETQVDYGDVVLWDSSPVTVLKDEAGPIPCFPLITPLHHGDEHRLRFIALEGEPGAFAEFQSKLEDQALFFVHRERIIDEYQDSEQTDMSQPVNDARGLLGAEGLEFGKLVLSPNVNLRKFEKSLNQAVKQTSHLAFACPTLYELLGDTARAGKEHQAFAGIERHAGKLTRNRHAENVEKVDLN